MFVHTFANKLICLKGEIFNERKKSIEFSIKCNEEANNSIMAKYFKGKLDNLEDVIKDNPTFKAQTIRGCCNGNKKTAYGYIWRYIDDNGNVKYKI